MFSMDYSIIMILSMLVLSAFFSGMEIAYVSSNKVHIAIEKQQDGFLSKILQKITNRPSKFIATMLIGNNIALVIYGFFMGDLLMSYIGPYLGIDSQNTSSSSDSIMFLALFIQTIISTFVILITAEFLPKFFFRYTQII